MPAICGLFYLCMNNIILTVLCYIEKDDEVLFLLRNKKFNDINKNKYIGVGGHIECDETPEECVIREIREETGFVVENIRRRGLITFVNTKYPTEYIFLFTCNEFIGKLSENCDEGELHWIKKSEIQKLKLWEGDRIFLQKLFSSDEYFSLKLVYEGDNLLEYKFL